MSALASVATLLPISLAQAATLDPGPGQYTFSGSAMLSTSQPINFSAVCNLELTGDVQENANGGVTITVTDGNVSGSFLSGCNAIGLQFPWTATVPQNKLPPSGDPSQIVMDEFENVVVTRPPRNTPCNGGPSTVPVSFSNGSPVSEPSSFMFDADIGECSVQGTVEAENDVDVTH